MQFRKKGKVDIKDRIIKMDLQKPNNIPATLVAQKPALGAILFSLAPRIFPQSTFSFSKDESQAEFLFLHLNNLLNYVSCQALFFAVLIYI